MKHKELIEKIDHQRIVDAIQRAEKSCSGEIRVHIEPNLHDKELRWYAERTFERLGLTKTAARNGVLLFIAAAEQKFCILGDSGIDAKVPAGFWDEIAAKLTRRFQAGEYTEGIVEAIDSAGAQLCVYFPWKSGDVDELTNEVSVGKGEHH
jgi:uncharacterized membrane protein